MNLIVPLLGATALLLCYAGLTTSRIGGRALPRRSSRHLDASVVKLLGAASGVGVAALVLVAAITGAAAVAVLAAVTSGMVVAASIRGRERRRRGNLCDEWPDILASLISAVRAGISLPEACAQLADRAGPASRHGFASYLATYRATGSFSSGLERLRSEMADPIADRVVVSLQAAHELGGSDLVAILQALGEFVNQDLRVRKEIEARWSWNVTAARVAAAAPPIILLLMASRPEGAAAFGTATGSVVVMAGAVATALGYRLMLRVARLPADERLR